ncbi:4'-phosphopantetheinyl transferase superfamily protein [Halosquirtibacter laminarini]|uniref:4'-phosphopantetheinyl transferase superfamily protein n=1 Tax=Halosquirtibacter laminarini TaxID=3374600 RepID=A0AC61NGF1_9BACT|nr:4'-phosphopantetheinyl transferase superfamily protein [Prolixibacteraceae bacterium]
MNKDHVEIYNLHHATLAICKISKVEEKDIETFRLSIDDIERIKRIKNNRRKREWIISRMLVKLLLNGEYPQINYLSNGKPYLRSNDSHLSISHSMDYVAVIISNTHNVAVDVENIHRKIIHIKDRFINKKEQTSDTLDLFKLWCAKEAVYKILEYPSVDLLSETTVSKDFKTIHFSRTNEIINIQYIHLEDNILCYIIR